MSQFLHVIPAAVSDGSMGSAFMTGLTLLVVVFAVLILLAGIIWLFGRGGSRQKEKPQQAEPTPAPAPSVPTQPAAKAAKTVDTDEDGAVVAAIAAAVAMMAPAGVTYQVKKITPAGRASRPAWAAAAVHQNTAPF